MADGEGFGLRDPVDEPKFQAMMEEIRADMDRQRGQLSAMIERGEIDLTPGRGSD